MTDTMRELARVGIRVRDGDNFEAAYSSLNDKHPLAFTLVEGWIQLLTLGYVVPWPAGNAAPVHNYFHITENGRQWAQSSNPPPEDSEGFMTALIALIPNLDDIVKQYVLEASVTYSRQAWFASAVMIGAASEKIVYMLLDAFLIVTPGKEGKAIEKVIKERNLPNMFDRIDKALTLHIESDALPYEVHEGCQQHLLSLFEAIRAQRNEAVHPTVGEVTPTTVRLTLSAFPSACRKVYDLIEWCRGGAKGP